MIDPQQLAAMQAKTKSIKAVIRIDYPDKSLKLSLNTDDPEGVPMIPQILTQFAQQLATQLYSFMMIEGRLVEHGKETPG